MTVSWYDTTLRDGAQAEGISFSVDDKLHIAQELDRLGIDYIEGGWPNPTSEKDREFFRRARDLKLSHARLAAFGSTRRVHTPAKQDANLRHLLEAETPVVTIFGKSWELHVQEVLRTTQEENLRMIEESVAFLKDCGREVIYDAEHFFDGYAQNPEYALATLAAAERGGADCVVLCDTNGGALPFDVYQVVQTVQQAVSVPLGIHTHNDSGLAAANALLAVQAGVSHVQGTINGYGERCGNANLCTLLPTLALKLGGSSPTPEQLVHLTEISRFVSELANLPHDERQPYVGASAFAHKGGAHIDGVTKTKGRAFEHVSPDRVGNRRRLLLSDQSGTSTIVAKLENLFPGIDKRDPTVVRMLEEVKRLEYGGYQFEGADASFELLAHRLLRDATPLFNPTTFRLIIERREDGSLLADATVKVCINGELLHTAADGDGPVNALDKALRKALTSRYPQLSRIELKDYKVRVLEGKHRGTASPVRVLIESGDEQGEWGTVGVSENIIEASFEALVDSLEYGLQRALGGQKTCA